MMMASRFAAIIWYRINPKVAWLALAFVSFSPGFRCEMTGTAASGAWLIKVISLSTASLATL